MKGGLGCLLIDGLDEDEGDEGSGEGCRLHFVDWAVRDGFEDVGNGNEQSVLRKKIWTIF